MKTRFIIETVTEHKCVEAACYGTSSHTVKDYTYALPDGTPVTPQVGDVYFGQNHTGKHRCDWTNCDGLHLHCVVPDEYGDHPWNIDGRAGNCDMKQDTEHRCWVRHGDPRVPGELTVDKKGVTCRAGAGSIQTGTYHGHLIKGELLP